MFVNLDDTVHFHRRRDMLKKVTLMLLLVLLALGSASVVIVNAGGQPHSDQVRICHFPGHTRDFVAGNQDPGHAACGGPKGEGSMAIWVSESACQNGHGAVPSPNGNSCTDH